MKNYKLAIGNKANVFTTKLYSYELYYKTSFELF